MGSWTHAHSIIVGVLVGLMFAHHVFWLVTVVFVLGLAVGRTWGGLSRIVRDGAAMLHRRASEAPRPWPPEED